MQYSMPRLSAINDAQCTFISRRVEVFNRKDTRKREFPGGIRSQQITDVRSERMDGLNYLSKIYDVICDN